MGVMLNVPWTLADWRLLFPRWAKAVLYNTAFKWLQNTWGLCLLSRVGGEAGELLMLERIEFLYIAKRLIYTTWAIVLEILYKNIGLMCIHQKLIRGQYKPETILVRYCNTNITITIKKIGDSNLIFNTILSDIKLLYGYCFLHTTWTRHMLQRQIDTITFLKIRETDLNLFE